jgi:DNA-binding protein H-NS
MQMKAGRAEMAKTSLSKLDVDALLKLRDDIERQLSSRGRELEDQLSRLGIVQAGLGKGRRRGTSPMKGRKVAVKYRDKAGNTWAGRGAQPRWLTAAIKAGAKLNDFLVDKSAGKRAKKVRKKRRAKK